MNTYEFDVESKTYGGIIRAAEEEAAKFFGDRPFDYSFCAIQAPNLKDWYQARVSARERRPQAPEIGTERR